MWNFNKKGKKTFAISAQGVLLGYNLTLEEAQQLSESLITDCGEKMVVLINQKLLDLQAIIQSQE